MENLSRPSKYDASGCFGVDHLRSYEFSYLNALGKPIIKQLDIFIPASNKSIDTFALKKCLRTIENSKFNNDSHVLAKLRDDIFLGIDNIELSLSEALSSGVISSDIKGSLCIDEHLKVTSARSEDIKINSVFGYSQKLHANNFLFTCSKTHQPVWGRVFLSTKHFAWDVDSVSSFFASYRDIKVSQYDIANNIYNNLLEGLTSKHFIKVQVQLSRRGGIESNFIRCNQSDYSWLSNIRCIVQ